MAKPRFIEFSDTPALALDCLDERRKYLWIIKERIFQIAMNMYEIDLHLQDYPPTELKDVTNFRSELLDEMVERIEDFNSIKYDYKKDWELNYKYN